MKRMVGGWARRFAPDTFAGLNDLALTRARFGDLQRQFEFQSERLDAVEAENARLRDVIGRVEGEVDEIRRAAPRIAELYDVVFRHLAERTNDDRPGN